MSHQALYRAWRPECFHDVCGQDTIIRTLTHQIMSGQIAHAYLFCGSRGTGKTSTAKVLARAINCQAPVEGEPCGHCNACLQLKAENNLDILEMDAASNNGVDEIRNLRDKIAYPPSIGRYKVYIVDEVHMLSTGAFNALLKTLEEPPSHAVFILATTEPQKLPATILSRCQRYDFRRISADVIVQRMKTVLAGEGREATEAALAEIARAAEGGMRDALSVLDMCLSVAGQVVDEALVRDLLGEAGRSFLFEFADAVLQGQEKTVFLLIDRLVREGRDAGVFAREVVGHMRALLASQWVGETLSEILETTEEEAERYRAQAKGISQEKLMRVMSLFIQAEADMKWAAHARAILELNAVRACRADDALALDALAERVHVLETALANGGFARGDAAPAESDNAAPREEAKGTGPLDGIGGQDVSGSATLSSGRTPSAEAAKTDSDAAIFDRAVEALAAANPSMRNLLKCMKFHARNADTVVTVFAKNAKMQWQVLGRKKELIEAAMTEAFGHPISVTMDLEDTGPSSHASTVSTEARQSIEKAYDVFGRDFVEVID